MIFWEFFLTPMYFRRECIKTKIVCFSKSMGKKGPIRTAMGTIQAMGKCKLLSRIIKVILLLMCHSSLLCVFAGTTDNFGMRNEPLMDTSKAVTDFMTNMANYRLSIILPTHTKDFMLKEPTCLNTPINLVLDLSN